MAGSGEHIDSSGKAGAGSDPFLDGVLRVAAGGRAEGDDGEQLIVDVAGFEGPLDLLLAMARTQKVDITRISILALAEQYLGFIAHLREMRLELAADYLVMAAWLAYLKSRLLLPEQVEDEEGPSGEELAAQLAFRLRRLEAMREAAAQLMTRNRLGRDVFARGAPEGVRVDRQSVYGAELYDLLKAYATQREHAAHANYTVVSRPVITLREAREVIERLVGASADWASLSDCLADFLPQQAPRVSAIASSFGASLELAREGRIELQQDKPFAPLYLRRRGPRAAN
ncbi:MAG: segregation/condensation protein A [Rhodobiaceae bacterium]|nr:segregation/condensation protein A [Rhodobiaceae bacterium]